MMEELHTVIVTRAQAKKRGMKNYFSGKPCANGSVWYRTTATYSCFCSECRLKIKARTDVYNKEYYKENKESISKAVNNYRSANKEWYKEYSTSYKEANQDRIREYHRAAYLENPEKFKERRDRYYKENMLEERERKSKCRLERNLRKVCWDEELTSFVEKEARDLCKDREQLTGFKWSVDHMYPLVGKEVSGFHHWSNIQCIPSRLNQEKHNSMMYTEPFEWLKDCAQEES